MLPPSPLLLLRCLLLACVVMHSACSDSTAPPGAVDAGISGDVGGGGDSVDGSSESTCSDRVEECNGLDDDCDGKVDEDLAGFPLGEPCYHGPPDSVSRGQCLAGIFVCQGGVFDRSICRGQVLPTDEACDGEDNDCDGAVDESAGPLPLGEACWTGSEETRGVGRCAEGVYVCRIGRLDRTACVGQVLARDEWCDGSDDDCDGEIDEGCDEDGDEFCSDQAVLDPQGSCRQDKRDCDDERSDIYPGALERCDGADNNCDGLIDEGCDDDNDGYCAGADAAPEAAACPLGGGDCNDDDPAINPGAKEYCDAIDHNCDGLIGDGCDEDGDGWCDDGQAVSPERGDICPRGPGDCNDLEADAYPNAAEVCDGLDSDCDGMVDEGCDGDLDGWCADGSDAREGGPCIHGVGDCDDGAANANPGLVESCDGRDNDCNGLRDDGCDLDGDGWCDARMEVLPGAPCGNGGGDCAPLDARRNPGQEERCNDLDDDCDGEIDEGCDDDGDGWCDDALDFGPRAEICPFGGGDCDDQRDDVRPGAAELCDGVDNDCDGGVDPLCDSDGDGWCRVGAVGVPGSPACQEGSGDCDDQERLTYPGAEERCDGRDRDCDQEIDEGCDDDGDGSCDHRMRTEAGATCPFGGGDCDDNNALVRPGLQERCDNLNNDCIGLPDEGCDDDGDGWCDASMEHVGRVNACWNGPGDCNDDVAAVHPRAEEQLCSGLDEDCDPATEDAPDRDGDGADQCAPQTAGDSDGLAADCDDGRADRKPGLAERCDGVDNDCDGVADEGNPEGGAACGSELGECRPGETLCVNGSLRCEGELGPSFEICADGLDQDCDGAPDGICPAEQRVVEGFDQGDLFGFAVTPLPDVTGDGRDDMAVGAPGWGQQRSGRVCLVSGGDGAIEDCRSSHSPYRHYGYSLASLELPFGVGEPSVLAGSPYITPGNVDPPAGRLDLLDGSDPDWRRLAIGGQAEGDWFGVSVISLPDQDANGFPEIVAGAWFASTEQDDWLGAIHLISLESEDWDEDLGWERRIVYGDEPDAALGFSLAPIADLDGDGLSDFIAGAPYGAYVSAYSYASRERIFRLDGSDDQEWFGASLVSFDDLNGDQRADFCVGAPYAWVEDTAGMGTVSCFSGADQSLLWEAQGDEEEELFGWSMARLADQDGDGVDDLLVGAPYSTRGGVDWGGEVWLLSGRDGHPIWNLSGRLRWGRLGRAVKVLGDLDGDDVADLAISQPSTYQVNRAPAGRVRLYSLP